MISTKLRNTAGHMMRVAERGEPIPPVFLSTAAAVLLDLANQVQAMEEQPVRDATRYQQLLNDTLRGGLNECANAWETVHRDAREPARQSLYARIWEATRANFQRQAARKGCPDV